MILWPLLWLSGMQNYQDAAGIYTNLCGTARGNIMPFYEPKNPQKMSKLFCHYLAGQLHCLSEILPCFAPTVNSYKRLVKGLWAPTSITWGIENRTAAFRVYTRKREIHALGEPYRRL